ncbi:unnamed protein product [Closterium sp. Naga37s-1]|nr:unnamed protein product [Closterium sp. Naga37s-1]
MNTLPYRDDIGASTVLVSSHSPAHPRILCPPMRSQLLTFTCSSAHSRPVHAQTPPHSHLLIRASHACPCADSSSHSPTHPRIPCPPMRSQLLTFTYSSAHSMPAHAQPAPHIHLLIRAFQACPCANTSSLSPTHPRIPCPPMRRQLLTFTYSSAHPMPAHAQTAPHSRLLIRASHACPCADSSSLSPDHPRIPCPPMRSKLLTLTYSSAHPMPAHAQTAPHIHLLIRAFHARPCAASSSHSPTHPRIPCPPMRRQLLTFTYSSAHPMPAHAQTAPHIHLLIRASHARPCADSSSHAPTHPRIPCLSMRRQLLTLT